MDHDTYSANDAIGRVNLDGNILVEKMRMQELERLDETHILPIYDTLNGGFDKNVHFPLNNFFSKDAIHRR